MKKNYTLKRELTFLMILTSVCTLLSVCAAVFYVFFSFFFQKTQEDIEYVLRYTSQQYDAHMQFIEDSLIAIGTSPYYKETADKNFDICKRLFMDCQDIRRSGSAAMDLAYVACGRLDGYFERNLKIWDVAAGMLLVREAGGSVLAFNGAQAGNDMVSDIAAGNSVIAGLLTEEYL